jgi:hypothetical protein
MGNLTVSQPTNIRTPDGNSLAVFIDGVSGVMKLKDALGNVQPLSDFTVSTFASFFSTQTQSATTINTPKAMTLNNTDIPSSSISVASNSRITVNTTGIYNLQFSAQVDRVSGSGLDVIDIWYRVQGVDVPNSNTKITIAGNVNESKVVASWNFYISLTANQYVELMYSVTDLAVQIVAETANLLVPFPATPSLIVTMQKIN